MADKLTATEEHQKMAREIADDWFPIVSAIAPALVKAEARGEARGMAMAAEACELISDRFHADNEIDLANGATTCVNAIRALPTPTEQERQNERS